jgi:signal transduction histidine kinase
MLEEISIILDAAKLDSGLFTIQKTNADLKKIIDDTINSYRAQAQNKFINLTLNIDPFIPAIPLDELHIRRVLNNLVTNSFKFTPRGGTVTVHAWRAADKIHVSVTDTGDGIPKDKQQLMFTKFSQIKTPNATIGTGLGLYISKGIVEAHGGTISLQSEPTKGTTVTFTLPYTSSTQTLPLTSSTPPEKPLNPLAN